MRPELRCASMSQRCAQPSLFSPRQAAAEIDPPRARVLRMPGGVDAPRRGLRFRERGRGQRIEAVAADLLPFNPAVVRQARHRRARDAPVDPEPAENLGDRRDADVPGARHDAVAEKTDRERPCPQAARAALRHDRGERVIRGGRIVHLQGRPPVAERPYSQQLSALSRPPPRSSRDAKQEGIGQTPARLLAQQ